MHSGEKQEILSLKKIRQIISLVKTLFSQNFGQESVTVNFRNLHTVF